MLAARWRMPIITVTITIGTLGALITSITGALAAHPAHSAHSARYAFAARPQAVLKFAPSQAAPLVTDAVGKPKSKRGQAAPPMSQAMLTADALRQRAALSYLRQAHPPAAKYLAQTQQAQVRS